MLCRRGWSPRRFRRPQHEDAHWQSLSLRSVPIWSNASCHQLPERCDQRAHYPPKVGRMAGRLPRSRSRRRMCLQARRSAGCHRTRPIRRTGPRLARHKHERRRKCRQSVFGPKRDWAQSPSGRIRAVAQKRASDFRWFCDDPSAVCQIFISCQETEPLQAAQRERYGGPRHLKIPGEDAHRLRLRVHITAEENRHLPRCQMDERLTHHKTNKIW